MQEDALFEILLRMPATERASLLNDLCESKPELRKRLEELLRADFQVGNDFLQSPLLDTTVSPFTTSQGFHADLSGKIIAGKYKLLERIGEGGMATVWLAMQQEPVKRNVAIKLIKAGMDTKAVIARFEAERQALALMDHPNIAKVLDGGICAYDVKLSDGSGEVTFSTPFFVMELVKGVPITEFADARKLNPRERLKLFLPVCSAIQHAHLKGVIHRDIKPSNVLVALYDDLPVPKVIDFGIAKATGQLLTEKTLHTQFGTVLGTLEYMSPEQASLNNLDVDTRSDTYSLGVLLYELLAGTPPLTREEMEKKGMLEILQMVRDVQIPRPSMKLSTSSAKASIAANRNYEPSALTGLLRIELDWIVMKALEKDRTRRYETASGLSEDIQRYLNGETVLAHPPSLAYRVKTFVRRHSTAVTVVGLVSLALFAGMGGIIYGLLEAEKQRNIAEKYEERVMEEFRANTDDALEYLIAQKPDLGEQEKEFLRRSLERWKVFAHRQGSDERSDFFRAESHFQMGLLWFKLSHYEDSMTEFDLAVTHFRRLEPRMQSKPNYQQRLSLSYLNRAKACMQIGKHPEALSDFQISRKWLESLIAHYPEQHQYWYDHALLCNSYGVFLLNTGKINEASEQWRHAKQKLKRLNELDPNPVRYQRLEVAVLKNLGGVLEGMGAYRESLQEFRAGLEIQKNLIKKFPGVSEDLRMLALLHHNLGRAFLRMKKWDKAKYEYEESIVILSALAKKYPAIAEYQKDLARSHNSLSTYYYEKGEIENALKADLVFFEIQEKLALQFPDVLDYQVDLGGFYCNHGNTLRQAKKPTDSLSWFDKGIRLLASLHEKHPEDAFAKLFLANTHENRALAFFDLGKHQEAIEDWNQALKLGPANRHNLYRAHRTMSLVRSHRAKEAIDEAEMLISDSHWSASDWVDFASIFSIASNAIPEKKREYQNRAMEFLQKAVKMGFNGKEKIENHPDFISIRSHEDYRKLMDSFHPRK